MTRLTASYKSFHNTLLTVIWTKLHNFWLCPLCVTYKVQILSYSLYHLVQVGCYLLSFGPLWNLFLHLGGCLLRPLHLLLFLAFFAHDCCEALTGSVRVKEALSVISKTKSVSHGNPNKPACLSSVKRDSLPATSWKLTRCNNVTAPSKRGRGQRDVQVSVCPNSELELCKPQSAAESSLLFQEQALKDVVTYMVEYDLIRQKPENTGHEWKMFKFNLRYRK